MFNETSYSSSPGSNTAQVMNRAYDPNKHHRRGGHRKHCQCPPGLSGCGCGPQDVIVIQEPGSQSMSTSQFAGLPSWLMWAAIGVGAFLILKK